MNLEDFWLVTTATDRENKVCEILPAANQLQGGHQEFGENINFPKRPVCFLAGLGHHGRWQYV